MIHFGNIPIEKLQRIAMIFNFIFTILSYKVILTYKYFSKVTMFIGQLQKYVFISFINPHGFSVHITIPKKKSTSDIEEPKSKREVKFTTLLIFSLITAFFIIYYPNVLKSVLNFPFKLITKSVNI